LTKLKSVLLSFSTLSVSIKGIGTLKNKVLAKFIYPDVRTWLYHLAFFIWPVKPV